MFFALIRAPVQVVQRHSEHRWHRLSSERPTHRNRSLEDIIREEGKRKGHNKSEKDQRPGSAEGVLLCIGVWRQRVIGGDDLAVVAFGFHAEKSRRNLIDENRRGMQGRTVLEEIVANIAIRLRLALGNGTRILVKRIRWAPHGGLIDVRCVKEESSVAERNGKRRRRTLLSWRGKRPWIQYFTFQGKNWYSIGPTPLLKGCTSPATCISQTLWTWGNDSLLPHM